MDIPVGLSFSASTVVDASNTAAAAGSGTLEVFATPMLVALCENAAYRCIEGHIGSENTSVGTRVDISHTSATPVGMKVTAVATVTAVDRRRVEFSITARDEQGEIGQGTHTRFVVDKATFMEKTLNKQTL